MNSAPFLGVGVKKEKPEGFLKDNKGGRGHWTV